MGRKRVGSMFTTAKSVSANEDRYPDTSFLEAIELIIGAELNLLGFSYESIDRSTRWNRYPSDHLIQKKIDYFEPHPVSGLGQEPLSLQSYKYRFDVLFVIYEALELIEDDTSRKVAPEDWLSIGLEIGWRAYIADLDLMGSVALAEAGFKGSAMRQGKRYSMAKITIDYALSIGYSSTARIREYFESEPSIEEIEINIDRDHDDFGHTTGFIFRSSATGKSKSLKLASLPVTISEVKAERAKTKSLRDSAKR